MEFSKLTIKDVPLASKVVLVRADYNVPLTPKGKISDDFRIKASLPTIKYLVEQKCTVVLISHLGRPKGREPIFSLEVVASRLEKLLGQAVKFVPNCVGDEVSRAVKKAPAASVLLLENLRFFEGEEQNSSQFAKLIVRSTGARYFVQDGFGVVHRSHASTDAITQFVPAVAGLLLEREYLALTGAMLNPQRPLVAVVGGAKVSDKIGVIKKLIPTADTILIGGAMANTFLDYKGIDMKKSIVEPNQEKVLDDIYLEAHKFNHKHRSLEEFIVLPKDVAVASKISATSPRRVVALSKLKPDDIALDIGTESIEKMVSIINEAKTVIWNGTLGYAELPEFAHGSARLALALASKNTEVTSVIGGGDTADFALRWDASGGASFTHISTGGGASLELMAGNKLPGIECLLARA